MLKLWGGGLRGGLESINSDKNFEIALTYWRRTWCVGNNNTRQVRIATRVCVIKGTIDKI